MNRMKLEDYKNRCDYWDCVYRIDKPHQLIKYDRPIEVYYENIIYDGKASRFLMFDDGEFITNTLTFPCKINYEDVRAIAKDLVDELLSMSDFEDLNRELNGMCACGEYENTYKSCDECPRYNKEEKDEDGCLGAMYSIPSHANWWEKTETKWNKTYGYESENHKLYKLDIAKSAIREAVNSFKGEKEYMEMLKSEFKRITKLR